MRLRVLIKNGNANFLVKSKASIGIEFTRPILTITYEYALQTFRNTGGQNLP